MRRDIADKAHRILFLSSYASRDMQPFFEITKSISSDPIEPCLQPLSVLSVGRTHEPELELELA